jgi:hypothetical protein
MGNHYKYKKFEKEKYSDIMERTKKKVIILNDKKEKMKALQEVSINNLILIFETIFQYNNTYENTLCIIYYYFLKR